MNHNHADSAFVLTKLIHNYFLRIHYLIQVQVNMLNSYDISRILSYMTSFQVVMHSYMDILLHCVVLSDIAI